MWISRWFYSTNHKNIGTLYMIFGIFSALIGTSLSILIRIELTNPGNQIFVSGQIYNVIVTARALIMSAPMWCGIGNLIWDFNYRRCWRKYFVGKLIETIVEIHIPELD